MLVKMKKLAFCAVLLPALAQAYNSGSTGADGAFSPTSDVRLQIPESGVFNFSTVNIPAGVTVRFKRNAKNTPVSILATGDVTIAGTIDLSGGNGGNVGSDGSYPDLSDDGLPGLGGPGGYDGGRGGLPSSKMAPNTQSVVGQGESAFAVLFGGAGLGPGGGGGGKVGAYDNGGPYPFSTGGIGGAYVVPPYQNGAGGDSSNRYFVSVVGGVYGSAWLQPLLGGSGGGGGGGREFLPGTGGGGGGGALLIASSGKVSISGAILANGGNGGWISGKNIGNVSVYSAGTGGGGSGGAIRIAASQIEGAGKLSALGGAYGQCIDSCRVNYVFGGGQIGWTYGSAGSYGRIRLESPAISFTGTATPTVATSQETSPALSAQLPTLKIVSVAGAQAPASPTGSIDIILPADTVNPVTVGFATTGVPLGNLIKLTILPAYGNKIEVTSTVVIGTAQSGTATAQVSLPAGSSVMMASTSYTVSLAMGEALSQFANNERVEKLTLLASLNGASQVKLTTISGKEFTVSAAHISRVLG